MLLATQSIHIIVSIRQTKFPLRLSIHCLPSLGMENQNIVAPQNEIQFLFSHIPTFSDLRHGDIGGGMNACRHQDLGRHGDRGGRELKATLFPVKNGQLDRDSFSLSPGSGLLAFGANEVASAAWSAQERLLSFGSDVCETFLPFASYYRRRCSTRLTSRTLIAARPSKPTTHPMAMAPRRKPIPPSHKRAAPRRPPRWEARESDAHEACGGSGGGALLPPRFRLGKKNCAVSLEGAIHAFLSYALGIRPRIVVPADGS